jgi:two-component system chemotaxis sensor kinase CheA
MEEEIELDRSILDEIGEPLLHLIRNAADHGVEASRRGPQPASRPKAASCLSASRERNSVALRVS